MSIVGNTYLNQYGNTAIGGGFLNTDYANGSQLAWAYFKRDVTVGENLILGTETSANVANVITYTDTGGSISVKLLNVTYTLSPTIIKYLSTTTANISSLATTVSTNTFNGNQTFQSGNVNVTGGYVNATDLKINGTSISGIHGSTAGNNTWTGTNSFNSFLPTSTLTPSSGTQLVTKTYTDSTFGGLTATNTWSGTTNTFSNSIVCPSHIFSSATSTNSFVNSIQNQGGIMRYNISSSAGYFIFSATNGAGTGYLADYLRISNVGIGIGKVPSYSVDAVAGINGVNLFENGVNVNTIYSKLAANNTFTGQNIFNNLTNLSSAGELRIKSANGTALYINNDKTSGDVAINTGSPNSNTYIQGGSLFISPGGLSVAGNTVFTLLPTCSQTPTISTQLTTKAYTDATHGALTANNTWTGINTYSNEIIVNKLTFTSLNSQSIQNSINSIVSVSQAETSLSTGLTTTTKTVATITLAANYSKSFKVYTPINIRGSGTFSISGTASTLTITENLISVTCNVYKNGSGIAMATPTITFTSGLTLTATKTYTCSTSGSFSYEQNFGSALINFQPSFENAQNIYTVDFIITSSRSTSINSAPSSSGSQTSASGWVMNSVVTSRSAGTNTTYGTADGTGYTLTYTSTYALSTISFPTITGAIQTNDLVTNTIYNGGTINTAAMVATTSDVATANVTVANLNTIVSPNYVKTNGLGAWILDGSRTAGFNYQPVYYSCYHLRSSDVDDGFIVMPGFRLDVFANDGYDTLLCSLNNFNSQTPAVAKSTDFYGAANQANSVKLYYQNAANEITNGFFS